MRAIPPVLLALTLTANAVGSSVSADGPGYSWSHDGTDSGIRVFTSSVPRHGFDAVKASSVLRVPSRQLFDILQDFERYTQWYYHAAEVRVLRAPKSVPDISYAPNGTLANVPSGGPWLLWFRQHTPPLDDRWTVLHCTFHAGPRGSLQVEFHSVTPSDAVPDGTVAMDLRGYWQLRPLDAARTEVTFMLDVDPKTAVPAFLVDPQLQDVAVETLRGLERQAGKLAQSASPRAAASGGR